MIALDSDETKIIIFKYVYYKINGTDLGGGMANR